jgi:hypothetical protein
MDRFPYAGEARRPAPSLLRGPALAACALGALLHSAAAASPPPQRAGEVGRVRWSVPHAGEGWIPDGVALGADGSTVFAGMVLNHPDLRLYAAGSPEAVLATLPELGTTLSAKVALAAAASVAVSITTHNTALSGEPASIVAVVRSYDLGGDPRPLWERALPVSAYSTTPGAAVSDDGRVTLAWWSVESQGGMLVTAFDMQGEVISESVIGDAGILFPEEAALSRDGSTAFFSLPVLGEAVVYDVHAGAQKAALPDNGIFSGHAMSSDGRRFAAVSWEFQVGYHLEVYELDEADRPVLTFERIFPDSVRIPQVALDRDGSRLAYAVQEIGPEDAFELVLEDLDAGRTLFEKTLAAPGTVLQLWCAGLQLDDEGETLACASWGDSLDLTPEVFALDARGEMLVSVDSTGSGLQLALARDGELLFAGCKGTHAGVFGSGGDLYMIETRAQRLRLEGQPHVGAALALSFHAEPGFDLALLFAGRQLLAPPLGALAVDPSAGMRFVGAYPLAGGELETQLAVPALAGLADTTAHFQAVLQNASLGLRALSNKVSVRFLP